TMPSTTAIVSALALARGNPAVQPSVETSLSLLFRQSERFLEGVQEERGWATDQDLGRAVKTFWSAAFGAVLISQAGYPGGPSSVDVAATLSFRPAAEGWPRGSTLCLDEREFLDSRLAGARVGVDPAPECWLMRPLARCAEGVRSHRRSS